MFSLRSLLQLIFAIVHVSAVLFEDCGSAYDLTAVFIKGCQMRPPCHVTVGESVPVSIQFIADFVSNELDQDVVININHVNLRPEVTPERCETLVCPVVAHEVSSLTSVMSMPRSMALNQRGYLRWRVYNESGRQVLCYSVLVQTQSPQQKLLREALLQNATAHAPTPITNSALLHKTTAHASTPITNSQALLHNAAAHAPTPITNSYNYEQI